MERRTSWTIAMVAAIAAGCYAGDVPSIVGTSAPAKSQSTDATEPTTGPADLPCDVAALLSTSCTSCHGEPLYGTTPNQLLSHADLVAPSPVNPARTQAEQCLVRMRDTRRPMPPSGVLPEKEIGILADWINNGMPKGTCAVAAPSPIDYDAPPVCTSNRQWTRGNRGSEEMRPGRACVDCHKREKEGPRFSIAGTVFPSAHEPDDCYGLNGVTVVITDANGKDYDLKANRAGNFMLERAIALPYTAKVVRGDQVVAMQTAQKEGDCNLCHTATGENDARGRIVFPY